MIQLIAIAVIVPAMLWLQFQNWREKEKVSKALWIPLVWIVIAGSRSVSSWFMASDNRNVAQRYEEGTPLDAALFAFLIVCALFVLNRRVRGIGSFLRANNAVHVFYGFCAISIVWSDFPLISLKHWVKLVGDLTMALVVLTDPNRWVAVRRLLSTAALVLLPLSVLFILAFPDLGSKFNPTDQQMYYSGVTTQKNELGLISLTFGLGALWCFLGDWENRERRDRRRRLIVQGAILVMALWLVVKANSITSLSSFLLSATVMVLAGTRTVSRNYRYVHWVTGSAVGLAVFALFIDSSGVLLRLLGRNSTLTGRTDIWKAVLSFQTNPLIGTGFDSFWLGSRIQGVADKIGYSGITEAHNGYLEIYINVGWIGVALLVWMILRGYSRASAVLRVDPYAGRFQLAFIVAAVMYNLSEAGFRNVNVMWVAFLIAIGEIPSLAQNPVERQAFQLQILGQAPEKKTQILR
jgi:exopolysaccharide production protein ExoQ